LANIAVLVLASDIDPVAAVHVADFHIDLGLEELAFDIVPEGMVGLKVVLRDPGIVSDSPAKLAGGVDGRSATAAAW
jgi:hypothetical protein